MAKRELAANRQDGYNKLWDWFGLSYASFLTLPRVLMHEMPDEWQGKMADLLYEYDRAFQNLPDLRTEVRVSRDGRLVKMPDWLVQYRHPMLTVINRFRRCPKDASGKGE